MNSKRKFEEPHSSASPTKAMYSQREQERDLRDLIVTELEVDQMLGVQKDSVLLSSDDEQSQHSGAEQNTDTKGLKTKEDQEFSLFMQPAGQHSDTPSPSDETVLPLNVSKQPGNTPQTFNGLGLLTPDDGDAHSSELPIEEIPQAFNMLQLPGASDESQAPNHLGSTIKFPAAPETADFDSDGLFEESLNNRESPPSPDKAPNETMGPPPFRLGLKQTTNTNPVQQKSQYTNQDSLQILNSTPQNQRTRSGSSLKKERFQAGFEPFEPEQAWRHASTNPSGMFNNLNQVDQYQTVGQQQAPRSTPQAPPGAPMKQKLHINLSNITAAAATNLHGKKVSQPESTLLDSANSQDPYFYLQWRQQQQKQHKSCRSTLYSSTSNQTPVQKTKSQLNSNQVIYYKGAVQIAPPSDYGQVAKMAASVVPHTLRIKGANQPINSFQSNPGIHQIKAAKNYSMGSGGGAIRTAKRGSGSAATMNTSGGIKYRSQYSSSFSNASKNSEPVKSLSEVKKPNCLISFRFVNRQATNLDQIGLFRNLTELDVSGNRLLAAVPQLSQLNFLKKLNLAANQITEMWPLPRTLEYLNYSRNCLKRLNPEVTAYLGKLTTLDVSSNGLENLDGVEHLRCLSRLQARNNQIQGLGSLESLQALIEIDLENNPIDCYEQVLLATANKKDILVFNLKLSPLMVNVVSYEEFVTELNRAAGNRRARYNEAELAPNQTDPRAESIQKLLKFLQGGVLYRNQRVYMKIKQLYAQQPPLQQPAAKGGGKNSGSSNNLSNRSSSANQGRNPTSNGNGSSGAGGGPSANGGKSSSGGGVAFSPLLQNKNSQFGSGGGFHQRKKSRLASTQFRSSRVPCHHQQLCQEPKVLDQNNTGGLSAKPSAPISSMVNVVPLKPDVAKNLLTQRQTMVIGEVLDKLYEEILNEEELRQLRRRKQRRRRQKRLNQQRESGIVDSQSQDESLIEEDGEDDGEEDDGEEEDDESVDDIESDDELDYLDDDDLYDFQLPSGCYGTYINNQTNQQQPAQQNNSNILIEEDGSLDDLQTYQGEEEFSTGDANFPMTVDGENDNSCGNLDPDMQNQFLNESTADFNKQLRQVKQELREEGLLEEGEHRGEIDASQMKHELSLMSVDKQRSSEDDQKLEVSPVSVELIGKKKVPRNISGEKEEDAAIRRQNSKNPGFKLDLSKCNLLAGTGNNSSNSGTGYSSKAPHTNNIEQILLNNEDIDSKNFEPIISQSFRGEKRPEPKMQEQPSMKDLAIFEQQQSVSSVVTAPGKPENQKEQTNIQQITPKISSMSTNRVGRRNPAVMIQQNARVERQPINKLVVVKRSPTRAPSKQKNGSKRGESGVAICGNPKTTKPIFIPKLALHSIHRQVSDKVSSELCLTGQANAKETMIPTIKAQIPPKNLVVLNTSSNSVKEHQQEQVTLQMKTEYAELMVELNQYRKLISRLQDMLKLPPVRKDCQKIVYAIRHIQEISELQHRENERLQMALEDIYSRQQLDTAKLLRVVVQESLTSQKSLEGLSAPMIGGKVVNITKQKAQQQAVAVAASVSVSAQPKTSYKKPLLNLGSVNSNDFSTSQLKHNLINVAQKQQLSVQPKVMASTTRTNTTTSQKFQPQNRLNTERIHQNRQDNAKNSNSKVAINFYNQAVPSKLDSITPDEEAQFVTFKQRPASSQKDQSFLDAAKMRIINTKIAGASEGNYKTTRIPRTSSGKEKIAQQFGPPQALAENKTERKTSGGASYEQVAGFKQSLQQYLTLEEHASGPPLRNQQYTTTSKATDEQPRQIKPFCELATFVHSKNVRSDFRTQRAGSASAVHTYNDCNSAQGVNNPQRQRFGLYLEKMRERNSSLQERLLLSGQYQQYNSNSQQNLMIATDKSERLLNLNLTSQSFEKKPIKM